MTDDKFDPESSAVVTSVVNAEVPGIIFSLDDLKKPEIAPLVANAKKLPELGLGIYTNPSKGIAVLFNPAVLRLEEIKAVDAAGKLEQVLKTYASGGREGPLGTQQTDEETVAAKDTAPKTQVTQSYSVQPPIRPGKLAKAPSMAEPVKQKAPGAGALLNSLIS